MIELRDISKKFGAVQANDHVNIKVEPGTIHAIVGENGAGKSTLGKSWPGFISLAGARSLSTERGCASYRPRRNSSCKSPRPSAPIREFLFSTNRPARSPTQTRKISSDLLRN